LGFHFHLHHSISLRRVRNVRKLDGHTQLTSYDCKAYQSNMSTDLRGWDLPRRVYHVNSFYGRDSRSSHAGSKHHPQVALISTTMRVACTEGRAKQSFITMNDVLCSDSFAARARDVPARVFWGRALGTERSFIGEHACFDRRRSVGLPPVPPYRARSMNANIHAEGRDRVLYNESHSYHIACRPSRTDIRAALDGWHGWRIFISN